jgi:ABC-type branched-subunit amino acid transport system substrate-binding protein
MTTRLFFVLLLWLSACKAQQPTPVQQATKTEVVKPKTEEKKTVEQIATPKQEPFNFFLLLPVDLSEAFTLDSIVIDSAYVTENIDKDIKAGIDFYEGALLAVDSLRKTGANIKLKVIDLPGNDEQQMSAIWKINFDKCDAVFSMLRGKPLSTLNGILMTKDIPFVSCTPNSFSVVEKNKNAFCVQPSSRSQCSMMGEFAGTNFKSENIIVITSSLEKEQEWAYSFIKGSEKINAPVEINKLNFSLEGRKGFSKALAAGTTNTIFVASIDEDFVTTVYSAMDSSLNIYKYKVIGLPVWQHFESLDPRTMEKFNTLIFSPDNINFSTPSAVKFRDKFRTLFSTEPADGAYLAFDSFMLFGNLISNNELDKEEIKFNGLRSKYLFTRENQENAQENKFIHILKLRDYRYVRIND